MTKDPRNRITVTLQDGNLIGDSAREVARAMDRLENLLDRCVDRLPLTREEWNLIADASNGTVWNDHMLTGSQLVSQVTDAAGIHKLGEKWGVDVPALLEKLKALDILHAWAIIFTVEWFWRNYQSLSIDPHTDEWWRRRTAS